ncbi:MAG TPA: fibronectin [Candidatus Marinimicrobia bacterium]|nr:fibronectin [Candidatus Neomarinimicrobiota bacterium]
MKIKKFAIILFFAGILQGQVDPGINVWIRVGSLQSFFSAWGAERAWNANLGIYEGLQWPAWYWATENFVIDRYWLACRDFNDPEGNNWDYKATTFISSAPPEYGAPISITQTTRFDPPKVDVDGVGITRNPQVDGYHDESLPYDRKLVNIVNTSLGVTVKRVVYAFSQPYHDNYFLTEYILTNTGNVDADDEIELPNQTVKELYWGQMPRYATSREAGFTVDGQMTWGKYQWVSHARDIVYDGENICGFWSWLGQSEKNNHDNIGGPARADQGRLSAPQFAGIAMVYAQKSPSEPVNDPSKLRILGWHAGDTYPSIANNNAAGMKDVWEMLEGTDLYTGSETPMDFGIPEPGPNISHKPAEKEGNDGGGAAGFMTYGPWELAFGDSVKIVVVEGISGLDRKHCVDIGKNWYKKFANSNYNFSGTLPDGSSTSNHDVYKNTWFYTGKDSILQTFARAIKNYNSGFAIPQPPQPPTNFYVISGGDQIRLEWTPSPNETDADFGGYKIYRAIGAADSFYTEIFACGKGTSHPEIVREYADMSPVRGMSYFYYLTAFNDGSNNDGTFNPAGPIESNRVYTQSSEPAYLRRPQGTNLDNVRIVPNPFSIKAREYQYGIGDDKDKVMFLNIPGKCTIRIYTERGDLVETLYHTDGSGDHPWNLVSSDRQIVVSGLYIAHIEVTEDILDSSSGTMIYSKGQSTYKKLLVIR